MVRSFGNFANNVYDPIDLPCHVKLQWFPLLHYGWLISQPFHEKNGTYETQSKHLDRN